MSIMHEASPIYRAGGWPLHITFVGDPSSDSPVERIGEDAALALYETLEHPLNPGVPLLNRSHLPRWATFAAFYAPSGRATRLDADSQEVLRNAAVGMSPWQDRQRVAAEYALAARHLTDAMTRAIVTDSLRVRRHDTRPGITERTLCVLALTAAGMRTNDICERLGTSVSDTGKQMMVARAALCRADRTRGITTAQAIIEAFACGLLVVGNSYHPSAATASDVVIAHKNSTIADRLSPEQKAAMLADRANMPLKAVAEKYGMSLASARRTLNRIQRESRG